MTGSQVKDLGPANQSSAADGVKKKRKKKKRRGWDYEL
jgi:hypothetical protein